jgi:hypothetical protein
MMQMCAAKSQNAGIGSRLSVVVICENLRYLLITAIPMHVAMLQSAEENEA